MTSFGAREARPPPAPAGRDGARILVQDPGSGVCVVSARYPTTVQVSLPASRAPRSPLPLRSMAASSWSAMRVS